MDEVSEMHKGAVQAESWTEASSVGFTYVSKEVMKRQEDNVAGEKQ